MDNLIEDWQKHKTDSAAQYKKLVVKLSKQKAKEINEFANTSHDEFTEKINCLNCANCCTSIPPLVNETDIKRISKFLGIKPARFGQDYLDIDEDGDQVMKKVPCAFLGEENKCTIYEVRPKACREYPHTDHSQFMKNLKLHPVNAQYCPIVYHLLEAFNPNM